MYDSSLILGFTTTDRLLRVSEGQLLHYSIRCSPFELSRAVWGLGPEKGRGGIIGSTLDQGGHGLGKVSLSPRQFLDAGESDVEVTLPHLADKGIAGWQIEQGRDGGTPPRLKEEKDKGPKIKGNGASVS